MDTSNISTPFATAVPIAYKSRRSRHLTLLTTKIPAWMVAAIGLSCASILPAQTAPENTDTKSTTPKRDETPLKLSPFVVKSERDYGYRPTNSITATGIGAKISDTPVGISVLTGEFLEDTVTDKLSDALNWMAGVAAGSVGGIYPALYQVRGYNSDPYADGFGVAGGIQTGGSAVGIDRVEVIKGPSAVFHGNSQPGGTINIIYKKPSYTPSSFLRVGTGSYERNSGQIFATGPLFGNKVAYLLDVYKLRSKGWADYTGAEETAYVAGLSLQPIPALTLNLNYRDNDATRHNSSIPQTHTGFLESGLPSTTSLFSWVASNFGPKEPYLNMNVPESYLPGGYRFNTTGPQNFTKYRTTTFTPEVLIKVNDHINFRHAINFVDTYGNTLGSLNQTGIGPGGVDTNRAGIAWIHPRARQTKSELLLQFNTGPVEHKLLAGYDTSRSDTFSRSYTVPTNPTNSAGQPWLWSRDGVRYYLNEILKANPSALTLGDSLNKAGTGSRTSGYYLTDQIATFGGRLRFLLGVRRTKVDANNFIAEETTPQTAVLIKPFSSGILKDTSFFVNYTKAFIPAHDVSYDGSVGPNQEGIGYEAGIKTDWNDGEIVSTFSVFQDTLTNIGSIDILKQSVEGTSPWWVFSGETETTGAELDVVWTPKGNMQLGFNWTYLPTAEVTRDATITQQVGLRFAGVPKHAINLYGRYNIVTGRLKGAFVGGGASYRGTSRGNLHQPAWWRQIPNDSMVQVEGFLGYSMKLSARRELSARLNIKNLTNRGGFALGDTTRPSLPREYYLTVTLSQ